MSGLLYFHFPGTLRVVKYHLKKLSAFPENVETNSHEPFTFTYINFKDTEDKQKQ